MCVHGMQCFPVAGEGEVNAQQPSTVLASACAGWRVARVTENKIVGSATCVSAMYTQQIQAVHCSTPRSTDCTPRVPLFASSCSSSSTVSVRVMAHPLERVSQLDCPTTKRLPMPKRVSFGWISPSSLLHVHRSVAVCSSTWSTCSCAAPF